MSERDRYGVLRYNDRVRLYATIAANLGTALIAATAYRIFVELHFDIAALIWIIAVVLLIFAAHMVLGLLEAED